MPPGTALLLSGEPDPLATKGEMTSRPRLTVPTPGSDLYGTNEPTAAVARLRAGDDGGLGSQRHASSGGSGPGAPSPSRQLGLTPGLPPRSFCTSCEYQGIKFIKGCTLRPPKFAC